MEMTSPKIRPLDFFELSQFRHAALFDGCEFVWEAIRKLPDYVNSVIKPNIGKLGNLTNPVVSRTTILYSDQVFTDGFELLTGARGYEVIRDGQRLDGASIIFQGAILRTSTVELGKGVVIHPSALIDGPTILGNGTELRPRCFLRDTVLTGDRCVLGHASEFKNALLLNRAKAPHKAYVGDSILGNETNLGAGTCLANARELKDNEIILKIHGVPYPTGLRKMGAILGDKAETGCNSVCNPGTIIGRSTLVYPGAVVRGYYPHGKIVKEHEVVVDLLSANSPGPEIKVGGTD